MLKRLLVIVIVVVVVVLGLAIGALFIEFDTPALGKAMLAEAGARTGIAFTATDFRFRLSRGLRIEGVHASIPLVDGGRLDVTVRNLILGHELLPLLRRRLVFDEVVLDGATFHLEPAPPGQASMGAGTISYAALPASTPRKPAPRRAVGEPRMAIESAVVRHGLFTTRASNGEPVEVRGIAIEMEDVGVRGSAIVKGLEGHGTIAADSMSIGPYRTGAAKGDLTLGSGHVIIEHFAFPTGIGPVVCKRVDVDLRTNPSRYSLALEAQPLDVAKLLGSAPTDNKASLDVSGSGTGTDPAGFVGHGTVKLEEGSIPPAPALTAIDRFLSGDKIVGSHYDETEIHFQLSNEVVSLEPFELNTDLGNVGVRGSFRVDGQVSLQMALRYPRNKLNVSEIPAEIADLVTDSKGEIVFPILVSGTMSSPDVRPDWDTLRSMATEGAKQGVLDKLKEKIGEGIEQLFGTKKEQ